MSEHNPTFTLHPRLTADTLPVAHLGICDLLLANDSRYAWCILVPRIPGLRDFHELPAASKPGVHEEIDRVSLILQECTSAYKINVAALGNLVEQLHIHVIARHQEDAAWPGPVWGVGEAVPYSPERAEAMIRTLSDRLS